MNPPLGLVQGTEKVPFIEITYSVSQEGKEAFQEEGGGGDGCKKSQAKEIQVDDNQSTGIARHWALMIK